MDVNLIVTLTFSERLFQLIEDRIPTIEHRVQNAVNKQVKASAREETKVKVSISTDPASPACRPAPKDPIAALDNARAEVAKAEAEKAEAEKAQEARAMAKAAEAEEKAAKAAEAAKTARPEKEKPAIEQIREIMERTRRRFMGEDYAENTGSEPYKKYHRPLTSQFRQIATVLGYEKPTKIDTPEMIARFAAECDALIIDENGLVSPPSAPY